MRRLRLLKRLSIFARRRPLSFLLTVLVCLAGLAAILEQFSWGQQVNRFIPLLFSAESFAWIWFEKGWTWQEVFGLLLLADAVTFSFDYFVIRQLLFNRIFSIVISVLSKAGKMLLGRDNDDRSFKEVVSNGMQWNPVLRYANNVKNDPSGANLWTVCVLAILPRFVTVVIGGTALAVLVVRYNRFGTKGWTALFIGMMIRTIGTVMFYELVLY